MSNHLKRERFELLTKYFIAYLERQGTPIGSLDMLIAAHALSLNAVLITNNEKEFKRVSKLKIENWAK